MFKNIYSLTGKSKVGMISIKFSMNEYRNNKNNIKICFAQIHDGSLNYFIAIYTLLNIIGSYRRHANKYSYMFFFPVSAHQSLDIIIK